MANQSLLKTFPLVLMAGVIISFVTTPLICKSLDLRNDHENQCQIYSRLLQLNVSLPGGCPYDKVMDLANTLMIMGSIFLCLVIFLLGVMWVLILFSTKCHRLEIGILSIVLALASGVLGYFMLDNYEDLYDFQNKDEGMNLKPLQPLMKESLVQNFVSDNITSANETSNQWNILFIQYDCCGVKRITGTTNDFDTTPWCTTSGSCQQTNSQIPKSCCRRVTEEDYQSAHENCHESVIAQTYNERGCYVVLNEKIIEERIQHNLKIKKVLCEEMNVLIVMGVCIIMPIFGIVGSVIGGIKDFIRRKSLKKEEQERQNERNLTETNTETYQNGRNQTEENNGTTQTRI